RKPGRKRSRALQSAGFVVYPSIIHPPIDPDLIGFLADAAVAGEATRDIDLDLGAAAVGRRPLLQTDKHARCYIFAATDGGPGISMPTAGGRARGTARRWCPGAGRGAAEIEPIEPDALAQPVHDSRPSARQTVCRQRQLRALRWRDAAG